MFPYIYIYIYITAVFFDNIVVSDCTSRVLKIFFNISPTSIGT